MLECVLVLTLSGWHLFSEVRVPIERIREMRALPEDRTLIILEDGEQIEVEESLDLIVGQLDPAEAQ